MKSAPIPHNDAQRLQALRDLLILDTPAEQRFDRIVNFAANEFDVPVSMIALIDENRNWFKARFGVEVCEAPRETSFCGHAIHSNGIFVVEDALGDERFSDNPFVMGQPFIRFYAGAPLTLPSGLAMGTLCLMDLKPRTLDDIDLSILGTLRDLCVEELLHSVKTP